MKTQHNSVRPPTCNKAIKKYLRGVTSGAPPYPKNVRAIGRYNLEGQYLTVYEYHGELVFDAGDLGHEGLSINVRNVLGKLEKYLYRTKHLDYDKSIVLKYTSYWG